VERVETNSGARGLAALATDSGVWRGVRGATDVFFATDEHGFSRIIAGGGV